MSVAQFSVEHGLEDVRRRINKTCERSRRNPDDIRLIAVSKGFGLDAVLEARNLGVTDFGENRVQEARDKVPEVDGVHWHLLGHLQSNKAKLAARYFDAIHSFDNVETARRIAKERDEMRDPVASLIEVNLTGIPGRAGVPVDEALDVARGMMGLPGIHLMGLMTIAAPGDPAKARDCFARLRVLRDQLEQKTSWQLPELSMGMTDDFEIAIEEGATMVRIGRGVFGLRTKH